MFRAARFASSVQMLNLAIISIRFIVITITPVLAASQGLLLPATANIVRILLIPPLLLLRWRLNNSHQQALIDFIKLIGLPKRLLEEEEVFFARLIARKDGSFLFPVCGSATGLLFCPSLVSVWVMFLLEWL